MKQQSTPINVLSLIAMQKPKEATQQANGMMNRASRGAQRNVFNENLARVPGLYNENAKVNIEVLPVEQYDFLNLTA